MRFASPLPIFRLTTITGSALLLFSTGCVAPQSKQTARDHAAAPPKPITVAPVPVGEVAVVNRAERFVLIDLGSHLYVPEPGAALRATGAAGDVSHLKTSAERKRPFIAADIIDGEPQVGDRVVQ